MTYIERFSSRAGADNTVRNLREARQQMEDSFRDDERRDIPHVKAAFEAIDEAIAATQRLADIFAGSGTHKVADFMPDDTGFSANDRAMNGAQTRPWFA